MSTPLRLWLFLLVPACAGGRPTAPPPPPSKIVVFQRTQVTAAAAVQTTAFDASGLELALGGGDSRCGPHTARIEYVARDGPIPDAARTQTGHRCEAHTLVHHEEVRPSVLVRLTCTVTGEFEGSPPPSLCAGLVASMSHGEADTPVPEASSWSVRPAPLADAPDRVEYFQPGARIWFPAASHRPLDLMPGLTARVLVTDVHHTGENTLIIAKVGDNEERVVFEDYVLGLEPAGAAAGPAPVDLHVTVKEEPEPMRATAACSVWRFVDGTYQNSGEDCGG